MQDRYSEIADNVLVSSVGLSVSGHPNFDMVILGEEIDLSICHQFCLLTSLSFAKQPNLAGNLYFLVSPIQMK